MPETFLGTMTKRACPVCGSAADARIFAPEQFDADALDEFAFASRKRPEHMRLRLVECPDCDLVYASPVPTPDALAAAYEQAAFDSAIEARFAAATYIAAVRPVLDGLPDRVGALDIGTGDGAFLGELLGEGFSEIIGIEPSSEPIQAAEPRVQGLIRQGVFTADAARRGSLSLVTCFQTIEHVPDPAALVAAAAELLKPGGLLVIVCHDRRAFVNRALGLRSPIIDIEHQQLFSPASVGRLLDRPDLRDVGQRAIANRYPIRYWARLLPLPPAAGAAVDRALTRTGFAGRAVSLRVGNRMAWARRA